MNAMRWLLVVASATLLGSCGLSNNMEGRWVGYCLLDAEGYDLAAAIDMTIDEDKGGDLEGEVQVNSLIFEMDGDIEGGRDGADVELEAELDFEGYTITATLEGSLEGDKVLEGDCTMDFDGYNYDGSFVLQR